MSLDIVVVGTGTVGTNLGVRFAQLGHRVRFAVRDTGSASTLAALERIPAATAVALEEAGSDATSARPDLVVLAVPYAALADVLARLDDLPGVTLVDATNNVGVELPDGCATVVDAIHRLRPGSTVVKAFNTIGAEALLDPLIDGRPAFLPIAGGSEPTGATATVARLAISMGFDVQVIGGDDGVAMVEAFARLWIHLAFREGRGRDFGFARVTRSAAG